jgi:hypothetical protein
MKRSHVLWCTAQVVTLLVMFPVFFTWVPWIASQPIAEVPRSVAALMPAGCPAVFGSHQTYSCFWLGSIHLHPFGFAAHTAGLLLCWGVLIGSAVTGRGFSIPWGKRRGAEVPVRRATSNNRWRGP